MDTNIFVKGSFRKVSKAKCPKCGCGLKIEWVTTKLSNAINVKCKKGDYRIWMCKIKTEPPWVAEHGKVIET